MSCCHCKSERQFEPLTTKTICVRYVKQTTWLYVVPIVTEIDHRLSIAICDTFKQVKDGIRVKFNLADQDFKIHHVSCQKKLQEITALDQFQDKELYELELIKN